MDFISNKEPQIKAMLSAIGASSVEELFADIPNELRLARPAADDGLSEFEGIRHMEEIGSKNQFHTLTSYLGGGAYEHHVPAIVSAICSKSEFLTSYTPYQAETSQGMLQAIFEFQSAVCAITGMDASNASLYDGATACAESLLMSLRLSNGRNRVVLAGTLNPAYIAVVEQALSSHSTQIDLIPFKEDGHLDFDAAKELVDGNTAAVLLQTPNFFGVIDQLKPIAAHAKEQGAYTIICGNPLSYGIYASPAELGADIAVGDMQPLGLALQYGGPYVGYIACKNDLVRQMPGRIIGETVDMDGKRGFVLTLQAREQHIRREKATSNICTNQALAALAVLVTILWYGNEGFKKLALTNFQRASYLREGLKSIPGVELMGEAPIFNEFAFTFGRPFEEVESYFRPYGIIPGLDLGRFHPNLDGMILTAVTETKTKEDLDRYLQVAQKFLSEGEGAK